MKKLLLLVAMVGLASSTFAQGVLFTNVSAAGVHLLSTNRVRVYSIETSATNAVTFKFWDNDNTTHVPGSASPGWWGTNFVNGAYVSRSTYPTSYVNTYIGYNGYTNYTTNVGIWGLTTTNSASTNAVTPIFQAATSGAETRVSYVDATFSRGILMGVSGAGSVTIYYRQEQ